jgi:thiol:disulfide interchange protein DsbD
MKKLFGLVGLALLAVSVAAFAQDWFQGEKPKPQWVELVSAPVIKVAANGHATATLQFRVKPEMHINSHLPHSDLLIPTELVLPQQKAIHLRVQYPTGHDITLPFDSEKLNVYTGDFAIEMNALAKGATAGRTTVPAELKYQACNDSSCFPPKSLKFDVEVQVAQ